MKWLSLTVPHQIYGAGRLPDLAGGTVRWGPISAGIALNMFVKVFRNTTAKGMIIVVRNL